MSALQSNLTYDDFQPKLETQKTPESHLLLIHLPGFERDNIGAKFEFDYRRVRVFGERPLGDNRFIRFNIAYPVPGNCDVNKLKGKFQGGIYTLIMPKKVTSREISEELKPTEQEAPKSPTHTTEAKPEMLRGVIPPKSTTAAEQERATAEPKPTEQEAPKSPTHTTEPKPEMVQEVIPPKSTTAAEQERATAAEVEAEKGKVGIYQQPKSTIESQKQADETLTPPEAADSMPPQKLTSTRNSINQTEEKFTGVIAENGEKQRVEKKETMDDSKEISTLGKPQQKDVMDDPATEKESGKETKESAEREKGKGEERGMNGKPSDSGEGHQRKEEIQSKWSSASQAMTNLVKRYNEDRQMLIYTSATVLVVALGFYASYKFRSSARP